MKTLSEPAVAFISRRELLYRYFKVHAVPRSITGSTLTIEVELSGLLHDSPRVLVTYTHDEVMHVLGEMKLKGLPFVTIEEQQAAMQRDVDMARWRIEEQIRHEQVRNAQLSRRYESQFGTLTGTSAGADTALQAVTRSFWKDAASKFFGKT